MNKSIKFLKHVFSQNPRILCNIVEAEVKGDKNAVIEYLGCVRRYAEILTAGVKEGK